MTLCLALCTGSFARPDAGVLGSRVLNQGLCFLVPRFSCFTYMSPENEPDLVLRKSHVAFMMQGSSGVVPCQKLSYFSHSIWIGLQPACTAELGEHFDLIVNCQSKQKLGHSMN